ncbi:MAG: tyrosine-type recombinase/integrase [Acidobacteriota bacterium]
MKEQWLKDPLAGYEENARHLFSYPDSTMHEYGLDLRRFLKWLEDRQVEGAQDGKTVVLLSCNRERIEDYIACLSSEGLKATTINRKIFSLNSFFVWAVHQQLMPASPLVGVRKLKIARRIPKFLTFEDIEKLLTYTGSIKQTSTIRGKQIHAMMSILYYLGIRREELVNMEYSHIEKISDSEIYLHVFGKGDKQRMIPFPPPAFEAYQAYNRFRPECATPKIFINLKTRQPMSKFAVNSVCDRLHKRLKLSKKLSPHVVRHSFATHLHLKGQPIEHINALLGHSSMNTTLIYVSIDAGKLRGSVEHLYKKE